MKQIIVIGTIINGIKKVKFVVDGKLYIRQSILKGRAVNG